MNTRGMPVRLSLASACARISNRRLTCWTLVAVTTQATAGVGAADPPLDIGSRRELFIDDFLVEQLTGEAELRLHHPVRRNIAIVHDDPWEGNGGNYHTVFRDGDRYRMYYHAWQIAVGDTPGHPVYIGYAESSDGIDWEKPNLGLVEIDGSKQNNIVMASINGAECHDLSVFKDGNPLAPDAERYKAVGFGRNPAGLYAFHSPDGLRWTAYNDNQPVMTGHPFDTQNIAFWDANGKQYRAYIRDFDEGRRDIMTATSDDLIRWTPRQWLRYGAAPDEQLYTNQVKPYYRAPHIYIGLPSRYVDRGWVAATDELPSPDLRRRRAKMSPRYGSVVTDALLMTSRDGLHFQRWDEAFLRPGLRTKHNWAYGDNYLAWHVVETEPTEDDAPRELSLYAVESYFTGTTSRLRRYTLRIDGFASIFAPLGGGEVRTKPVTFTGNSLHLNFATAAGGSVRVELQDADGTPIPGFALADCDEVFGDSLDYVVRWRGKNDVGAAAGRPVRLRFEIHDADVFSLQFQ